MTDKIKTSCLSAGNPLLEYKIKLEEITVKLKSLDGSLKQDFIQANQAEKNVIKKLCLL